jgi:predicted metal-dependent phosphoesterase TrpH
MGFADLHIHSMYSYDGTASISAILKYVADFTDLNVIAITDHDSMEGIPEALDLAPYYNLEVIPGCEVSSKDGHVLCLFIERPIPPGLSLLETVLMVGNQGGICIAAHPMAKGVNSLRFETIRQVLKHPVASKILVGVEAFNGGLVYTRGNLSVQQESNSLPLAQLGNSDAHILQMIGQGASYYHGYTSADLKNAIINRTTIPRKGNGLSGSAVLTSYIPRYVLRKLGWVSWNESPEKPIIYAQINKLASIDTVTHYLHS